MKTYSIEHVLRKQLAYVPGSFSNIGRIMMVVTLENHQGQHGNDAAENDDLAITLNFYAQLFRFNEILEFNVIVVVDNRSGNWKRLRSVLKQIKTFLPQVAVALVVKSDHMSTPLNVKMWLNRTRQVARRSSMSNLCGVDTASVLEMKSGGALSSPVTCRPSTVLVISQSKLPTYVASDQLPVELGGTFDLYNHASWLIARISAERYIDRVEAMIAQRFFSGDAEVKEKSKQTALGTTLGLADIRVRHYLTESEPDVEQLIELGRSVSEKLSKPHGMAKFNRDLNSSVQMAMSSLEPWALLQPTSKKQGEQQGAIKNPRIPQVVIYGPPKASPTITDSNKSDSSHHSDFYDEPFSRDELEREINEVRRWLANDGDRLIMCETEVGINLRSAERLVDKFDMIELDCADIFARYGRLISTLDALIGRNKPDTSADASDLQVQRAELESSLRTFAMRVDRRRTLLLTCARFFRLLKKATAAVSSVSQLIDLGYESLTGKQLIALDTHRNRAEILGAKTFEEGARLVVLLQAGTGRPDVVRSYSDEISTVMKCSEGLRSKLDEMAQAFVSLPPIDVGKVDVMKSRRKLKHGYTRLDSRQGKTRTKQPDGVTSFVTNQPPTPSRVRKEEAIMAEKETIIDGDDEEDNVNEIVGVFVQTLEEQLATVTNFLQTFSNELSSSTDSRQLLAKYQTTYNELEQQWRMTNRCGLDFIAKIVQANSVLRGSTLSSIENAMLELNRQFNQLRTLWKDIQISKVQSDIVKLLEVCSRRSSSWSINSLLATNSSNSASPNSTGNPKRNRLQAKTGSGSSLNKMGMTNDDSLITHQSRQSSGLPSSASSSPMAQAKSGIKLKNVAELLSQPRLLSVVGKQRQATAVRRCLTSDDLTSGQDSNSAALSTLDEGIIDSLHDLHPSEPYRLHKYHPRIFYLTGFPISKEIQEHLQKAQLSKNDPSKPCDSKQTQGGH